MNGKFSTVEGNEKFMHSSGRRISMEKISRKT